MKQEEALEHLREMTWALQRYRSIAMETLGPNTGELYISKKPATQTLHLSEKLAAEMWPWIFGEKCPLPILVKMVDSGEVAPADYYNMMFILDRFIPEVKAAAMVWRGAHTIPEGLPSMSILKGWE